MLKQYVQAQTRMMDIEDEIVDRIQKADEEGATMIEYALLAGLISIAAVATLKLIGPKILAVFDKVNGAL